MRMTDFQMKGFKSLYVFSLLGCLNRSKVLRGRLSQQHLTPPAELYMEWSVVWEM